MYIPTMSDEFAAFILGLSENFTALSGLGADGPGFHNSIYRGISLGTSVTAAQYAAISAGTFKDLYIGDYWTINNTKYLIAAFDYYYDVGDTALKTHHVTLVPKGRLYIHAMNDTNTTEGGYLGSLMYGAGLNAAKTTIKADFSGHVLTLRRYLSNTVTGGQASAGEWVDSDVELMNEAMVYGTVVNGAATYGYYNIGTEKSQLPLFRLRHDLISFRSTWWLRDVCSSSYFAHVASRGIAARDNASSDYGVRPAFSIS